MMWTDISDLPVKFFRKSIERHASQALTFELQASGLDVLRLGDDALNESSRLRELRLAATRLMDSDLFATMPGFTVPSQERTRVKTSAMIAVAAYMLQTRDFSAITVDEIAYAAGCTTPSIYARFQNKEGLLPAIHLLTIEETRIRLDAEIILDRFVGGSLEHFFSVFINIIVSYFEDNHNFVRAIILGDVQIVHSQLHNIIPTLSMRINKVVSILLETEFSITYPSVEYGIGIVISMLRDAAVTPNIQGTRDRVALTKLLGLIVGAGLVPAG